METLWQDLRYAARMFAKSPGFTGVAVLTLALGIGANSSIFSLINAVLLRPLPFKEPDRLVMVWERRQSSGDSNIPVSGQEFAAWREQSSSLEDVAILQGLALNLTGAGDPAKIPALSVSPEFFPALGLQPVLGRTFLPGEDQAGDKRIVVLNAGLWKRRFGSDPDIIGKAVTLSDQSYTVVGVMSWAGVIPWNPDPDVWLPIDSSDAAQRAAGHSCQVLARLKSGVTLEVAQKDLAHISEQLEQQDPNNNLGHRVKVSPLEEGVVGSVRPALLVLFGAVGFVLLIACANVANLSLTRASARQKEIAIRTALGAPRRRLVRQLLTESCLLAVMGGGVGLLLALWITDLLPRIDAVDIPRLNQISIDGRVMGMTIGFSLLTGIITGMAPALRRSKPNLSQLLNDGMRTSAGPSRRRFGNLLVVLEVALALVLLVGGGLMLKSFARLVSVDPGFDPHNVLRVDLSLPGPRYPNAPQQRAFYEQLIERIKVLPGVEAVGATSQTPLKPGDNWAPFLIEGRPAPSPDQTTYAAVRSVSADYFRVMNIPLRQGRAFTEFDIPQATPNVIINETMAHLFWLTEDPLGTRIRIAASPWLTVVGVVGDVRHGGLNSRPHPEMFLSHLQAPQASLAVMVRTSGDSLKLAAPVREQVGQLDKDLPMTITTMDRIFSDSVGGQRFNALLLTIFGVLALVLAVVGVFGVVNYSVAQRTREIGVRIALGAQGRDIFRLVVGQGMVMTLLGIGIGLAGAFALTGLLSGLLFRVSPTDPVTFLVVSLLLSCVALLASYIPARRAMSVDPMVALRYE